MLPPCLAQPAFSWDPGPPTAGWALLHRTLILKSTPTSQPYGGIFVTVFPFQMSTLCHSDTKLGLAWEGLKQCVL